MKIIFLGATKNVTGSKFVLETDSSRILIDCGIFQERDFRFRNWDKLPIDPAGIDAVLLTHAHIDHCGYLPKLAADGFSGKIFCTPPTADISKVSLIDSAHLQLADAQDKKKRHQREGRSGPHPEVPLYTIEDVEKVFPLFSPVHYLTEVNVQKDIKAVFYDAGHILGSSMIELVVYDAGQEKRIVFSGDIGRWGRPIIGDPYLFQRADYVVMEATYGARDHEQGQDALQKLAEVIKTTKKSNGNIVIPTFAIGRAQELMYDLNQLVEQGRIPELRTFMDSPMAINITKVFNKHTDYFDAEAQKRLRAHKTLFQMPMLKFTSSVQESKEINHEKGTCIIMSSSGMCTGGRIKHHLVHNISKPESTILFVGYQAKGTLGRYILEQPRDVRILGHRHPVKARIETLNGFSAHAGQSDLLRWVTHFNPKLQKVIIVHAEEDSAYAFAGALQQKIPSEILIPDYLEEMTL